MDFQTFSSKLSENFAQNGLSSYVTPEITEKFYALTNIMTDINQVMNITAIREVDKIIPLHYADCLKVAHLFPPNAKVLDVGCGGGFPTLPLAIVRPDLTIVGVDSTEKKAVYVGHTAIKLGLSNVTTLSARAEDLAKDPRYREQFDCVTSRAVARLHILSELCLPFVKIGGQMVVMKGATGQEELAEAQKGMELLGGKLKIAQQDTLLVTDEQEIRFNIVVDKITSTPARYPRQFGQIKKRPL